VSDANRIVLISGTAHPELSQKISIELDVPLANAHVGRFTDGEVDIKVYDDIRGGDVFVLQPTCPPVNDNWIELLLLIDCLRRASAGRITAVMPYYGYARKDRKDEGRVPISAKVVANTLAGTVDRVVTIDMHAAQIQGFYDIPVDHLYARPVLMQAVRNLEIEDPMMITPDVGGIKMARAWAKMLGGADLAIVDKRRISGSEIAVEHVIGDVEGRNVIIIDDMISTGGSITEAARIVRESGAKQIVIAVSHAVLCGPAVERLDACPADKILVTDTIPVAEPAPKNLEVISVAGLLAKAIHNIHSCESVSSLFDEVEEE
jgi:ribose-phosphate pyrophosphokinase